MLFGLFIGLFEIGRFLLKNPLAVIYCDYFQPSLLRENFFGNDADRFLAKTLLRVLNLCNLYTLLTKKFFSIKH